MVYIMGIVGALCLIWGSIIAIMLRYFALAVIGLVLIIISFFLAES